ncbi:sodium/hydrogen exchanger family protein [Hirsutella rhossiliensis]|uniref:Sodium/hydrogen exchanger family domain-containing protein n=1 Tax=Hirsutella rhossiliensis TaxID=111463 RepID=A0A9P8N047_9HYPO|nr:sodium/hydrogen exchanger family domain-containing protein [Hirsutella rhossiliensis]KAH0962307.1 sodium/hydrogen exchanger family domain-containing protein [Hirsutella rhossiliensis]
MRLPRILRLAAAVAMARLLPAALAAGAANATDGNRATPQGGVLEGANPSKYDPSNPIILFIIQVCLIVIVCHALHWPLAKIRQPRVIAEVVGGIILGPSVMGRIPGFREAIFPAASLPNLNLVANLGLVLYLFLIGLETDVRFLARNWRVATSVAFAGLALPFGIGCALAWGVYNAFRDDGSLAPIRFSVYMLFIGIAVAITAFPVLCRILTELKLLDTSVGVITLSAGVANDVVGWVLLALCVALVNAGTGLTALWILLCCLGFMLLLTFAVKPALIWLLRRTGSIENDPSQSVISLILLIALASSFFTGIIGVHPIFGSFMAGLILPRENRFNIRVTEKLEDLIGAIFLPLYFTLSGLNTNLGLLDSGTAWGYVFATTFAAFFTKIIGAALAARANGLVWRESFTIGVLMSCKGLVELIVLNIGLQANILSTRTFTIFVVMALLTTFATTPIVSYLYPPWYQIKIAAWKRGEIDWDTGAPLPSSDSDDSSQHKSGSVQRVSRMLAYIRLDSMPALLNLVSLFGGPEPASTASEQTTKSANPKGPDVSAVSTDGPRRPVWVHGMRLLQLTDRDSSVMTVSQVADYSRHDPVVNTFRTVGQLHNLAMSGEVAVMPEGRFAEALVSKAATMASDLLLVPWSETGGMGDSPILSSATVEDRMASTYSAFVRSVLDSRDRNVGVFFSRTDDADAVASASAKGSDRAPLSRKHSFGVQGDDVPAAALPTKPYHIFLAYFGGHDDKLALRLVLQLCVQSKATATIVRVSETSHLLETAQSSLSADTASRVKFETTSGPTTVEDLLQLAQPASGRPHTPGPKASTLVVVGRGSGAQLDQGKAGRAAREDLVGCLGRVAGHFVAGGLRADLLVVQAKQSAEAS